VLDDNGHFFGVALEQPFGHFNIRVLRVDGHKEMVISGQAINGYFFQHFGNQTPHGAVHFIAVVDAVRHAQGS
jgi:hypothetical protein